MAIIPCRECAHHISDQAASCPSCGAPVAQAVKIKPRRKRMFPRVLLTLMTLWTLGTLLWLLLPQSALDQIVASAQSSLQRLDPGIAHVLTAERSQAPRQTEELPHPVPAEPPPAPVLPVYTEPVPTPAPPPRSVYSTTAEQLYRDYQANVVAIETKIGANRVKLTGNVAAIDQDAVGRPVVKLWAGKDSTATMTLADDQRVSAAHLVKGEAVAIECGKFGRTGELIQGSDCTLARIDLQPKEVNLALFLADENGTSHVYIVGPMSEAVCRHRSVEISSTLRGAQRGEHVVSRRCTNAFREKIPTEGCRLNTSSVSIADLPSAHLWRYDCDSLTAAARPIPAAVVDVGPTSAAADHPTTNNIRLASASNSDTGLTAAQVPAEESTVAHSTQGQPRDPGSLQGESRAATPAAAIATPNDDLARVRAADPQAADHIAGYCAQTPVSANRDALLAYCRHSEADAWTRMVLQNEFPTMDAAIRKRCSEPPFPDTYVGKESCARYLLRAKGP